MTREKGGPNAHFCWSASTVGGSHLSVNLGRCAPSGGNSSSFSNSSSISFSCATLCFRMVRPNCPSTYCKPKIILHMELHHYISSTITEDFHLKTFQNISVYEDERRGFRGRPQVDWKSKVGGD